MFIESLAQLALVESMLGLSWPFVDGLSGSWGFPESLLVTKVVSLASLWPPFGALCNAFGTFWPPKWALGVQREIKKERQSSKKMVLITPPYAYASSWAPMGPKDHV